MKLMIEIEIGNNPHAFDTKAVGTALAALNLICERAQNHDLPKPNAEYEPLAGKNGVPLASWCIVPGDAVLPTDDPWERIDNDRAELAALKAGLK